LSILKNLAATFRAVPSMQCNELWKRPEFNSLRKMVGELEFGFRHKTNKGWPRRDRENAFSSSNSGVIVSWPEMQKASKTTFNAMNGFSTST
jgi:hypothetical protein